MKSLIIYYSFTGNTQKIAEQLKDILSKKGEAEIRRLEPLDESSNFFVQVKDAFFGKRAELSDANFDVAGYDLICLGTPVWAFAPTPAVNTFLDGCLNIDGKDAVCFTTYGSGTGVKRCINVIKDKLKEKGIFKISDFNIQQKRVNDKTFVEEKIKQALLAINL